nr:hypothetical protein [Rossellomorea aquimaris]
MVGFVPGLGAVADGVNALIYAVDGDYKNAGLSLLAAVPIYGNGAKLGLEAGGMVSRAVKIDKTYRLIIDQSCPLLIEAIKVKT